MLFYINIFNFSELKVKRQIRGNRDIRKWKFIDMFGYILVNIIMRVFGFRDLDDIKL